MPRFEPKITTDGEPRVYHAEELNWCLRNVTANLAAFKAEFLRRYFDGQDVETIIHDLLPDPPAAPVNDDARDAARFRWFNTKGPTILTGNGLVAIILESEHVVSAKWFDDMGSAIDAAMAREASK